MNSTLTLTREWDKTFPQKDVYKRQVLRVLDRRQPQRERLLPEVCVGDDPLAGVDHHRHRQQVGTVDRALRAHRERADVHTVGVAEIEHFHFQRFRVLVAREHLHAQVGIALSLIHIFNMTGDALEKGAKYELR